MIGKFYSCESLSSKISHNSDNMMKSRRSFRLGNIDILEKAVLILTRVQTESCVESGMLTTLNRKVTISMWLVISLLEVYTKVALAE